MSDVGNIYYKGFENLFGGAYGQRKMPGRHSDSRNTRIHPQSDPDPQPNHSIEFHSGHYANTNEQGYQNLDYDTNTDSNYWEQGQESNYDNYDYHEPPVVQSYAAQAEDLALNQHSVRHHEYTSSEAADYDYSSYDEYLYVPNYLEEVKEDDFR